VILAGRAGSRRQGTSDGRGAAEGRFASGLDLLASPFVHERVTRISEHRPWPMPRRPWIMGQTWTDLLFAHWSLAPSELEAVVPPQLALHTFDGRAWVGVTPFGVRNLRLRLTFPVPCLSAFPEINVRTYVMVDGKPGIFFFSLDAASRLAVAAARHAYRLPYFRARMTLEQDADAVAYSSERIDEDRPASAEFRGCYRPVGPACRPRRGTLEHWLTERYCLYTLDDALRVQRGEIHHAPWPLQRAEADIETNTMADEIGIALEGDPLLHYARRQDVIFWSLKAVARARA
jgi:uncharacterized protein YqjF (DUF2071 family)